MLASHWRDDCWRSTSPSITAWPRGGQVAGDVGGQGALADAALGIGDHDDRHAVLLDCASMRCQFQSPGIDRPDRGYDRAPMMPGVASASMPVAMAQCPPAPTAHACADILVHRRPPAAGAFARQPTPDAGGSRAADRRRRRPASRCATCMRCTPTTCIDVDAEQAALRRRPAGGVAAPDPLVQHAAADEAVGRRGAGLRLGLRAGGEALHGKDLWLVATTGGAEDRTGPTATTAISSTPSCRPTSRPLRCAACASCRRWCCTARTASATPRSPRTPQVFVERLRQLPRLARARELEDCVDLRDPGRCPPGRTAGRATAVDIDKRKRLMEHDAAWLPTA